MFSIDEIQTLLTGTRMVKTWGGSELGYSAQSTLGKIAAAIPAELRNSIENSKLFALGFSPREDLDVNPDVCRKTTDKQRLPHKISGQVYCPTGA